MRLSLKVKKIIITFLFLMALWLLLTLSFNLFSLALGIFFSLIIALLTNDILIEQAHHSQRLIPRFEYFIFYILILLREIYLSSFALFFQVITRRINPAVVKIKTHLKDKTARAILANSITLTPGTVTLELKKDELFIHWLDKKDLQNHEIGKLIKGNYEFILKRIFA